MSFQSFLTKKIQIPLWSITTFFFLAYFGWEAYWYGQVGLLFVKWHTHLIPLIFLWYLLWILLGLISSKMEYQYSLGAIMITFVLVELGLIATGFNKTYIENRSGYYQSLYDHKSKDVLRVYLPNKAHRLKTPEYDFERMSNRFGFSDSEFKFSKTKTIIQTYGDSFTEGDGAPADSSYPSHLKRILGNNYEVQNYGICGNDPGYYPNQFKEVGKLFNPSILVLSYCTLDFTTDVMSRGGLDRFTKYGYETKKSPWWEIIYATSYISRLFFHAAGIHYNNFFLQENEKIQRYKMLEKKWNEIFIEIAKMSEKNNTKILLIKKPERSEIDQNKYQFDFSFFDSLIVRTPIFHHFDMLPSYRKMMKLESGGTTADYYWVKDGHHNPKGYTIMAEIVKDALKQTQLLQDEFTPKQQND
jgi:hypothetical protein